MSERKIIVGAMVSMDGHAGARRAMTRRASSKPAVARRTPRR